MGEAYAALLSRVREIETVGQLVARCEASGQRLANLALTELQEVCPAIENDVFEVLGAAGATAALQSAGSGGAGSIARQLAHWQDKLGLE